MILNRKRCFGLSAAASILLVGVLLIAIYVPSRNAMPIGKIKLHLIPHSHTDAGWIETIDWYYSNRVRQIISSLTESLYTNPDRTFVWADTNFLYTWW